MEAIDIDMGGAALATNVTPVSTVCVVFDMV